MIYINIQNKRSKCSLIVTQKIHKMYDKRITKINHKYYLQFVHDRKT